MQAGPGLRAQGGVPVIIDGRPIGNGAPCYVIAEIGINHNGDPGIALQLVDVAADAGCDAVKLQVRTPEVCVPRDQWDKPRTLPDGTETTYIEYKRWIELPTEEIQRLGEYARSQGVAWFASCWDVPAVLRMRDLGMPAYKVASASLTDMELLRAIRADRKPVILSTGMSTLAEVDAAVAALGTDRLAVMHTTSAYPVEHQDINLHLMQALASRYGVPTGYSGHERGLAPTLAAVALGADLVERHITLDRTMWGTDQAASLEPRGLQLLVRDIRVIEQCMGTADKRVLACELGARAKLRGD